MHDASFIGSKARIVTESGRRTRAEITELSVVADGKDNVAVRSSDHLIRRDGGVLIAEALWPVTGGQVARAEIGQHRDLTVQQRHVEALTFAGALCMAKRRKY